jgi:hypothetical protein
MSPSEIDQNAKKADEQFLRYITDNSLVNWDHSNKLRWSIHSLEQMKYCRTIGALFIFPVSMTSNDFYGDSIPELSIEVVGLEMVFRILGWQFRVRRKLAASAKTWE